MTAPYHFHIGRDDEANALVRKWHYSKRPPANVQIVGTYHAGGGLFGDYGDAVAACFLCIPPTRWSEPVLELSRLVRVDAPVVLTGLIAKTCDAAKQRGHGLIVSFAGWTQEHHGGIYQAASWSYHGCRDRNIDGVLINGVFMPGRSCNSKWGTRSPQKLSAILNCEVLPHYDDGKHLYWRALGAKGKAKATRLGLNSMPYPKPAQNSATVAA